MSRRHRVPRTDHRLVGPLRRGVVLTGALALIAVVAACGSSGGSGDQGVGDTVAPDAVPEGFVPASVTFVSADRGVVLGAEACDPAGSASSSSSSTAPPATGAPAGSSGCAVVAATDDGGATWRVRPAPPAAVHPTATSDDPAGVSRIRFGDAQDGWAFGPGLWSTHDGGQTWASHDLGGAVSDLASADGVTYALVTHCPDGPCGQGATLYRTDAGTDAWQPVDGVVLSTAGGRIVLHAGAAWVVAPASDPTGNLLSASADGVTWSTRPDLCGPDQSLVDVAPFSTVDLFVLCVDSPGAGSEPKRVLRSTDGGLTAQPVSADPPSGGLASAIAAADAQVVAISASSGADWIYRTGDAGASWQAALDAGDEPLGFTDLGFTTASQGVAIRGVFDVSVDGSSQLLMTHDAGATWEPVSFR